MPRSVSLIKSKCCVAIGLFSIMLASCSLDPKTAARKYGAIGDALYLRGKYEDARRMYEKAVSNDLKSGILRYRLALVELRLQNYPAAFKQLRQAVDLLPRTGPESSAARIQLADLSLNRFRDADTINQAEQTAQELLRKNPNDFDGRRLYGTICLIRAEWLRTRDTQLYGKVIRDAVDEYFLAERAQPGQKDVIIGYARALAVGGSLHQAEDAYGRLLGRYPDLDAGYAELIRLFLIQGKVNEAQHAIEAASRKVSNPDWFLRMMAAQAVASHNGEELANALAAQRSHAKDRPAVDLLAGDFHVRFGDLESALGDYRRCVTGGGPNRIPCEHRIVAVLAAQGRKAEADRINSAILKENARDPQARVRVAIAEMESGNADRALTDLEPLLVEDPKNFIVHYQIARAHLLRNELEQARQSVLDALELSDSYLPAWIMLAYIQIRSQEYEPAAKTVKEILARRPDNLSGLLLRSVLEQRVPPGPAEESLWRAIAWNAQLPRPAAPVEAKTSGSAGPPKLPADSLEASIYLKGSACDDAVARYRELSNKPDDPFVLVKAVPGVVYAVRTSY